MYDTIRKLYYLFSPRERYQTGLIILAMIGMAILDVTGIASIMPFMYIVANPASLEQHGKLFAIYQTLHFVNPRYFLLFLGFLTLFILLIANTYTILTTWLMTRFATLREYRLSQRLLKKYLMEDYAFFLTQNSAILSNTILTQIQIVVYGLFIPTLQMIAKLIVTLLILTLLFWINSLLALASLIFLGSDYLAIFILTRSKLASISKMNVHNNQLRYIIMNELLSGIKDIKLINKEQTYLDRFEKPSKQLAENSALSQIVAAVPRYALETIAFGGVLLIVIYFLVTKKDLTAIIPMLALYAFACFRLMPALQTIFSSITAIKTGTGALDIVYQELGAYQDLPPILTPPVVSPIHLRHELSLKNIYFSYHNEQRSVLENLNLSIPANSTVGFVGATGCGKTTVADLISGLLLPEKGSIFVDNIELNKNNIRTWRKKIGYIPQHIYLADTTIAGNIALGIHANEIDMNAITRATRIANIHSFITETLSDQYETIIGERGIRLSGGQRQRIGIARALYYDPDVLILDEATSSLDSMTENAIMDAIRTLSRKKTIIIIAHRLATVKECDIIYLFDNGKIVDTGTFESLHRSNQLFKKLVSPESGKDNETTLR
ncbi:MAG: ABC transporter ATP-binding protein [Gammaproteobacteria bacterium]